MIAATVHGCRGEPFLYDAAENQLLDLIYGAALDVSRWPSVMEAVADAVGARNGCMTRLDNTTALGETIPFRIDDTVLQAYADYYYTKNVFTPVDDGSWRRSWRPAVLSTADHLPVEDYRKSEYFNDFMRKQDAGATLHICLDLDDTASSAIALGRPIRSGEFERESFETAARLQPHLIRSFRMGRALSGGFGVGRDLAAALDVSPRATFVVDENAAVRLANPAAERLLRLGGGLVVLQGRLTARQTDAAKGLHALIGAATARDGPRSGGAMNLPQPDQRFPLALRISPLTGQETPIFGRPRQALVCVTDLELEVRSPEEELRRLFGLTPAEARVATAVLNGLSLREAADAHQVSFNTVRSQLAKVYEKTGVTRQAELVVLMMRLSPATAYG
jgi:DNA-binding CsgD family transcriptional regulator/PAS domain-containing protein